MKRLLILLTLFSLSYADETYIYSKDVEGRESKTTWTLDYKVNDNILEILGESRSGKTVIITDTNRVTQSFCHESKGRDDFYSILREGDLLIATKESAGQKQVKRFKIGDSNWVQEFDFCFKPFILSNYRDFKFSIVHPKKLSLHNMVATKEGFEPVTIHGRTYDALKVKVTLTGFKKMFWHADLWFDRQAGDLLKYMANEGPNTPLSTITLFSKELN